MSVTRAVVTRAANRVAGVARWRVWTVLLAVLLFAGCNEAAPVTEPASTPSDGLVSEDAPPALTVGVYYYPWHAGDFHGGQYLREHLVPPQEPVLGEYDDRDTEVIGQHLAWSRYARIDLWVTSWWGPGGREDETTRSHILQHPDLGDLKIAILYETTGRTRDFTDYTQIGPDITYLAETYFGHPNYLRIDGKPVLFVYLTRVLGQRGTLESAVDAMREAAAAEGHALFIMGDHVFGAPPAAPGRMDLLDGVTCYDVYGSMGVQGYATQSAVDAHFARQARWKALAESVEVAFVPAVTPGFNDKAVREGHAPLSRQLGAGSEFGSLFEAMIQGAKPLVDPAVGGLLMVTSWNEWHEDTQIEPVRVAPATSEDDSETGEAYTAGLSYEGYGERYLQILRDAWEQSP